MAVQQQGESGRTTQAPGQAGRETSALRRIRPWGWAAIAAVLLVVVLLLTPVVLGVVRPDALPGTVLLGVVEEGTGVGPDGSGIEVGGLDGSSLRSEVAAVAEARTSEDVTVRWDPPDGAEAEPRELSATAEELGHTVDVDATVEEISRRGRQTNPITAWRDHIDASRDGITVDVVDSFDAEQTTSWAEQAAEELALEPVEGEVALEGASVERTDPSPGARVDADALADVVARAAAEPGEEVVDAEVEVIEPELELSDVEAGVAAAETVIDGEIVLSRGEGELRFEPEELGEVFDVVRQNSSFDLDMDTDALDDLISDEDIASIERDPISSDITLGGGGITISDSRDGYEFDFDLAAEQVREIVEGDGDRSQELDVEVVEPERSREEAEELGIEEPISEFTTEFNPGEARADNIRLIADMVDGVVLEPDETFSVNDHVGPRTREKGFQADGTIIDGELVDRVGGGVSQFATAMYNAIYFGGYQFLEFQPHSYYISRYPAGREATISYGSIDLAFRNNSPYGLLIDTSHTADSLTIRIWSTPWVEVDSVASDRTRVRQGEVRDGFDITVTRVLRFPDGTEEREPVTTRYQPSDQED